MPRFVEKMAWQTLCHGKMNIDITDISTRESEMCWFSDMFRLFLIPTYMGKFLQCNECELETM